MASTMASTLRAVTVIAFILSQVQQVQSKVCYESNGFESQQYYDCQPDADVSACCRPGDICYSNGLCHPGPDADQGITDWYWHGCTDPTFQDPSCFSACFSVVGDGVDSCPGSGPNHWCCYGLGGCDCNNSTQVVSALAGAVVATIGFDVTSISSKTTSTPSPTSPSTTTTTPPTTKESGAGTGAGTGAKTGAEAGATTGTTPSETPSSEKSKPNTVAIGVGAGVGGAAALAIVGLIFFYARRRNKKAPKVIGPEPKYTVAAQGPQYEMPTKGGNAAELSGATHPIEYYQELPAER
ncbi:hypothetical protein O988_04781 [Pseudogymnoascus sp. VKM F-3808]|nr:hypothetical protein O988_04781 [Pseudogymnoascus sp. VKM F-3808]